MKWIWFLGIWSVLLGTPADAIDQNDFQPIKITKPLEAASAVSVRSLLKDPESARFRYTAAFKDKDSGLLVVCGYVNAKNSFGGYVGDKAFQFMTDSPDLKKNPKGGTAFLEPNIDGGHAVFVTGAVPCGATISD